MSAIRHAEKRRESTCRLADRVAAAAIRQWRALAPASGAQACVAAVVAVAAGDDVKCLSLGAGTKLPPRAAVAADAGGLLLRDCHAEVLAVRAFKRYLFAALAAGGDDVAGGAAISTAFVSSGRGRASRTRHSSNHRSWAPTAR